MKYYYQSPSFNESGTKTYRHSICYSYTRRVCKSLSNSWLNICNRTYHKIVNLRKFVANNNNSSDQRPSTGLGINLPIQMQFSTTTVVATAAAIKSPGCLFSGGRTFVRDIKRSPRTVAYTLDTHVVHRLMVVSSRATHHSLFWMAI